MKNYSSNRAQKGKTGYRTPSLFRANVGLNLRAGKANLSQQKKYGHQK